MIWFDNNTVSGSWTSEVIIWRGAAEPFDWDFQRACRQAEVYQLARERFQLGGEAASSTCEAAQASPTSASPSPAHVWRRVVPVSETSREDLDRRQLSESRGPETGFA